MARRQIEQPGRDLDIREFFAMAPDPQLGRTYRAQMSAAAVVQRIDQTDLLRVRLG